MEHMSWSICGGQGATFMVVPGVLDIHRLGLIRRMELWTPVCGGLSLSLSNLVGLTSQ